MLEFEPLAKHHDKKAFDCGNDELNHYLQTMASQHAKKGVSKTFVLIDGDNPKKILGFYCLSAYSLRHSQIHGLPYEIPSLLLGRLAVDTHAHSKGLARHIFAHAFIQVKKIAQLAGVALIVIDVKSHNLIGFYEKMGFTQLEPNSLRMILSVKELF